MKKLFGSLVALTIACSPLAASAQWQETNNLVSVLTDPYQYSTLGTTATVTYLNQTATNVGATSQHMGMYLGWAWSYDAAGADTPLLWSNANNKFLGGPIGLTVTHLGFANQYLHLGDIVGDTWIGVPWAPSTETGIATVAGWDAPFFDFGTIAAGGSAQYDIELTFDFANQADFDAWNAHGSFYLGGQGVQTVTPEPSSIALVGFSLAGIAFVRRRRRAS